MQEELKRGLSLIDKSVNDLAAARFILMNVSSTLEENYEESGCQACKTLKIRESKKSKEDESSKYNSSRPRHSRLSSDSPKKTKDKVVETHNKSDSKRGLVTYFFSHLHSKAVTQYCLSKAL